MPQAVWSGTFRLFGVEVHCHVLDDGQRILEADDVVRLLEAMGAPDTVVDQADIEAFARWQKGLP